MISNALVPRRVIQLAVSAVFAATAFAASSAVAMAEPTARAAKTITVSQTAQMRLVRRVGTTLYEQGTASGTLPGVVSATLVVNVTRVSGQVTFYPRGGGTITFNAQAVPSSAGVNSRASGTMTIVRSTGRFSGARGTFRFNANLNRRSWAIGVSASGRMTY